MAGNSTSRTGQSDVDFTFYGDTVLVKGALEVETTALVTGILSAAGGITVTGAVTATNAVLTTPTIKGATMTGTVTGTALIISGATLTGAVTVGTNLIFSTAPSGTAASTTWTSGVPDFIAGQMYMTVTAGSTVYRIPLWLNA